MLNNNEAVALLNVISNHGLILKSLFSAILRPYFQIRILPPSLMAKSLKENEAES